jgi:hypothetical protein
VKNLKNLIKKIDYLKVAQWALITVIMFAPFFMVRADLPTPDCNQLGGVKCGSTDLKGILITIIQFLIGIAFLVSVFFLVLGGFRYITSAGNEETAGKGKKTIINALIGIVIVILSYVIVSVVSKTLSSSSISQ